MGIYDRKFELAILRILSLKKDILIFTSKELLTRENDLNHQAHRRQQKANLISDKVF